MKMVHQKLESPFLKCQTSAVYPDMFYFPAGMMETGDASTALGMTQRKLAKDKPRKL